MYLTGQNSYYDHIELQGRLKNMLSILVAIHTVAKYMLCILGAQLKLEAPLL